MFTSQNFPKDEKTSAEYHYTEEKSMLGNPTREKATKLMENYPRSTFMRKIHQRA